MTWNKFKFILRILFCFVVHRCHKITHFILCCVSTRFYRLKNLVKPYKATEMWRESFQDSPLLASLARSSYCHGFLPAHVKPFSCLPHGQNVKGIRAWFPYKNMFLISRCKHLKSQEDKSSCESVAFFCKKMHFFTEGLRHFVPSLVKNKRDWRRHVGYHFNFSIRAYKMSDRIVTVGYLHAPFVSTEDLHLCILRFFHELCTPSHVSSCVDLGCVK